MRRRDFLKNSAGMVGAIGLTSFEIEFCGFLRKAIAEDRGLKRNLMFAFNSMHDAGKGESDEYTTVANLFRIMREHGVPDGSWVTAIGVRTGNEDEAFSSPGELGFLWEVGSAWDGFVTNHKTGAATPLGLNDPIVVSQFCILDPKSAHRLDITDPSRKGEVLWTFHTDNTTVPVINMGAHNVYSGRDDGLSKFLFKAAVRANKSGRISRGTEKKLKAWLPALEDSNIWSNFRRTFAGGALKEEWLRYIKEKGWHAAGIVLKGSFMNVNQTYVSEWNKKHPKESAIKFFKGEHGPLKTQYGVELQLTMNRDTRDWVKVGTLWNSEATDVEEEVAHWKEFTDSYGHDFHIHGFTKERDEGGHTLFCQYGGGPLEVYLFPIQLNAGGGAYAFNNDLSFELDTITKDDRGLGLTVVNSGENFERNVEVTLSGGLFRSREKIWIELLGPRQKRRINFSSKLAKAHDTRRKVTLDSGGRFIEGGENRTNNVLIV